MAASDQGRRRHEGTVKKLINEGVDPKKTSSELSIRNAANRKKAGTCKFFGECNMAIRTGKHCENHQPIKPINAEKSDWCKSCGWVLGGGGYCNRRSLQSVLPKARGNSGAQKSNGGKESRSRSMLHTGLNWHLP